MNPLDDLIPNPNFGLEFKDGPMTNTIQVWAWNCLESNSPANVIKGLDSEVDNFNVAVITEAYHMHPTLLSWTRRNKCRLMQETPLNLGGKVRSERGDTAIIVKDTTNYVDMGYHVMSKHWIGPKHGEEHDGRRYPQIATGNPRFNIVGAHWPTGFGTHNNPEAIHETLLFAGRYLERDTIHPHIIVGDLNIGTDGLKRYFDNPRINVSGAGGPDNAVYVNCHGTVKKGPNYGSDHASFLYTFEAK